MDQYLGILLSADPNVFPLTRPTTLQATQSALNTLTLDTNALYPNIKDPPRPLQIYINPFQHI